MHIISLTRETKMNTKASKAIEKKKLQEFSKPF